MGFIVNAGTIGILKCCKLNAIGSLWGVDYDAVIGGIPPIAAMFLGLSMYFNGIFNANKVRNILLSIKKDFNRYKNHPENAILHNYTMQGKKFMIYYASYIYVTLLVYILIPTVHLVIDIVSPTNRSQGFLFELDYGVNSQQYFYYLTIHSYIGTAIVCHLLVSCYTMFVMYAQHAYALFAIVSYQLRTVHTFHKSNLINVEDDRSFEKCKRTKFTVEEYEMLHDKLFACIQGHKNALKYSYFLESLFTKLMIFQLFFSVLCLSTTGIYTVLNINNVSAVIRNGTFAFAQVFYIFSLCFPGQRLVDHSKEIYTATCEIMWYKLSKKSISLYKFLLVRSLVSSKLTALKMVPLTMETFIMIIQTAMSYFTVLKSTIDTRNEETSF